MLQRLMSLLKRKETDGDELTAEQRRIYAAERLINYRRIAKLLATTSDYILTTADLVPQQLQLELVQAGEFADASYAFLEPEFVFRHLDQLSQPNFPFEGYDALKESMLVLSFKGSVANVPGLVAYRATTKQLVVAFSGTANIMQSMYDLWATKVPHTARPGCEVHAGFWGMYLGLKKHAFTGVRQGLFAMDFLTANPPTHPKVSCTVAAFGSPRFANRTFGDKWAEVVASYAAPEADVRVRDYLVKGYNDGVPCLPPTTLGFVHIAQQTLWLYHGHLFFVPLSEREHGDFKLSGEAANTSQVPMHPRGGHNYYNGRDWEKTIWRLKFLSEMLARVSDWQKEYSSKIAQRERRE